MANLRYNERNNKMGGYAVTDFLLKLFVKDYKNTENRQTRSAIGKLAGTTGILCNGLLFLGKLAVGIFSGAVSVIADGLNNLSDFFSSVVTLLGFRLAQRPADKEHPYGHARYEYISALVVAASILFIGFELAKTSVERIFAPQPVLFSYLTVGVLVFSLAVKGWLWYFYGKLGKRIDSESLKASAIDSRNDVITSAVVLLGCLISKFSGFELDGYMGLGVAVFILYSGVRLAKETMSPLLGQRADKALEEKIRALVLENEKVLGLHDLLIHDYGPGKCHATVHVELSAEQDLLECHDMIDEIEWQVLQQLNVHLVIHYDPVLQNDGEWLQMQRTVEEILARIEPELSVHDFRIARGAKERKLVFDLAVPYDLSNRRQEYKKRLEEELVKQGLHYTTVIRFDRK
jgi:cation diffusion facilitator family transporter